MKRNQLALLEKEPFPLHHFEAQDLGLTAYGLNDIRGGDAQYNAQILEAVLQNQPGPYLETVVPERRPGLLCQWKSRPNRGWHPLGQRGHHSN